MLEVLDLSERTHAKIDALSGNMASVVVLITAGISRVTEFHRENICRGTPPERRQWKYTETRTDDGKEIGDVRETTQGGHK